MATERRWALLVRSLWAGPLVIVAILVLTACRVPSGSRAGPVASSTSVGANVIPWLAVPGTPLAPTQAPQATIACSATALRNDGIYPGGYQGYGEDNLHLTNSSGAACYFPGPPQMQVTLASGGHAAVSPADFAGQRVDLQPNQTVMIMFGSPGQCPNVNPQKPLFAQSLQVTFPGGGSLAVGGLGLDIQCGAPTVLLFQAIALDTPSSSLGALRAVADAPATAARGSTFTYTVTLTNPTTAAIVLSPFPSYTEGMSDNAGDQDRVTWLLNCQVAQQIAAGSSLTFAMQYTVPSSFAVGAAKLFWQLQVPDGPSAGAEVTIN